LVLQSTDFLFTVLLRSAGLSDHLRRAKFENPVVKLLKCGCDEFEAKSPWSNSLHVCPCFRQQITIFLALDQPRWFVYYCILV